MNPLMTATPDLWRLGAPQEFASDGTSVRILPRLFARVRFAPGTVNADIGGGRFDDVTAALAAAGVRNVVWDPYNRTAEENEAAAALLRSGGADTATVCNVLNVVLERVWRDRVVAQAADCLRPGGTAWFQVYEGDRSGVGRPTSRGWQENRRLASYLPEIAVHFADVRAVGGIVAAASPRPAAYAVDGVPCRSLEAALALRAASGAPVVCLADGAAVELDGFEAGLYAPLEEGLDHVPERAA